MLIAPLLSPILSFSLGIVLSEGTLISRSFSTLLKALLFSAFLSAVISFLFLPLVDVWVGDLYTQWNTYFVYFAVAVIAGFAASFASLAPNINTLLPGSAIAVTLIPPIAGIGIGLAQFNWDVVRGALIVFGINALGIVFSALVMYSLMNLYSKKHIAQRVLREEDKLNHVQKEHVQA